MDLEKFFRGSLAVETVIFLILVIGIFFYEPFANQYRFYELLGAVSAAMITTFGIYKMRQKT